MHFVSFPLFTSLTDKHRQTTATKIINGKLLSLTLGDADTQSLSRQGVQGLPKVFLPVFQSQMSQSTMRNSEKELKVEITFHHQVEAYGSRSEDVHRKLHPGESPRAVQGSAACVFWSEMEK